MSIIIFTVINLQEQYGGWSAHSSLLDSCPTELPSHEEASQVMFIITMFIITMFDLQDRLDTVLIPECSHEKAYCRLMANLLL